MPRKSGATKEPEQPDEPDPVWSNRFHWCALAAGFLAAAEGRLDDSEYVRKLAYEFYETGAFQDASLRAMGGDTISGP
jgi:hypothetical protein